MCEHMFVFFVPSRPVMRGCSSWQLEWMALVIYDAVHTSLCVVTKRAVSCHKMVITQMLFGLNLVDKYVVNINMVRYTTFVFVSQKCKEANPGTSLLSSDHIHILDSSLNLSWLSKRQSEGDAQQTVVMSQIAFFMLLFFFFLKKHCVKPV